jgi:adenine-specific DNA-methyltransferase
MAKVYKGSLSLEWYNKQKSILLQSDQSNNTNDIPAPRMNWVNKDYALYYEIAESEGKGVTPFWVDRNDIRVKEARPLILQKTFKGIPKDKPGKIPGTDILFDVKEGTTEDASIENFLIKGDNLLALHSLKKLFDTKPEEEKIKCIYIDPPYNTGSAFEAYDDNLAHSEWLTMTRDRLLIMRDLLSEDGSIWVSIDDSEVAYMRILLDEVFGREAFIACNVWQKRYSRENRQAIGDVHEYILVYAKNVAAFKILRNLVPPTEDQTEIYKNPNNDPKGRWRGIPMTAQAGHATKEQFYAITSPSGKVFYPPEGRCWSLSENTFKRLLSEGRIYFGKNGDSQPNVIRYLSEVEGFVPWTWWPSNEVGHTDESKKEMHTLFGKVEAFDTPKPERLMERIIHIATNEGDLVFDCFGGSGTTFAVAHKMKRRWIGIEVGQSAEKFILNRLVKVIKNEDGLEGSKRLSWQGGGAFKYYVLGPSIISQSQDGQHDFNWKLGRKFIEESMLLSYDYSPDKELDLQANELFKSDENRPTIGVQQIGSKSRVAIVSINDPNGKLGIMPYDEIAALYNAVKQKFAPEYINIFTNRGVEMAFDSKPDDLEIIKIPHAIFAELEK